MTSSESANRVKRFSRRQFLKTGTAAAVVAVVAGVGGFVATQAPLQPEVPSRATPAIPAPAVPTPPSTRQKVSVSFLWGGSEGDSFNAVLDGFEQRQNEIELERIQISSEEYRSVVTAQIAAGNPPDVVMLAWPSLTQELAVKDQLIPIDDLYEKWVSQGWYTPTWKDLGSVNVNGQASVSFMGWFKANAKGLMWYTTSVFRSVGILSEPKTWDEFIATLEQLKSGGITPLIVGGKDGWALSEWFEAILVRVAGPDIFRKLITHEISWQDPSVRRSFEELKELVEKYFPEEPLASGFIEALVKRTNGEAGIGGGGLGGWVNGITRDEFPGLEPGEDYTFFVMPKFEAAKPFTQIIGGDGMIIPARAKNVSGAKTLLDYLASPEAQEIWARRGGFIATNSKVPRGFLDPNEAKEASLFAEADVVLFDLDDQTPGEMQSTIWNELQRLFDDPTKIDEALANLENKAIEVYGTAPAPIPTTAVKSFTFTVQDKQTPWALVMNGEANPTITANVGDTVEIILTNDGQLPHTWTLDAGSPAPYDVNLRVLMDESDTIRFVADKPGTFSYYCAIAGHRDLGMAGEIVILG